MVYPEEQETLLLELSAFTHGYSFGTGACSGLFSINVEKKVFLDSGKTVKKQGDFGDWLA